jgi:hypothetical protein
MIEIKRNKNFNVNLIKNSINKKIKQFIKKVNINKKEIQRINNTL